MSVPAKSEMTAQRWLEDEDGRKAQLAKGLLATVEHVDQALARSGVGAAQQNPRERGMAAYLRSVELRPNDRENAIAQLGLRNDSPAMRKLQQRVASSRYAFETLSVIGYQYIRDLHAEGLLYPEIAEDFGIGLNDLLAFMRSHPDAPQDAKVDAAQCADTRIANILREMSTGVKTNRTEVDALKNRGMMELELAKRLSGAWAQHKEEVDAGDVAQATQLHLNISQQVGQAPGRNGRTFDEDGKEIRADGTVEQTPDGVSISFKPS